MKHHHANLTMLALVAVASAGVEALAQTLPQISIDADRPLTLAAKELGKQLGVVITFEEMPFEHPSDFEAVKWRSQTLTVPKSGQLSFQYLPSNSDAEIINSLLDTYHETLPGKYKLIEETVAHDDESSTVFHIVPDSSKDSSGSYVLRPSVLDVPVKVHTTAPTAVEQLVCDVIDQAATRQSITIGCMTDFAPQLRSVVLGNYQIDNVSARTSLVNLLSETGSQITWTMLRSSETGDYTIHFNTLAR